MRAKSDDLRERVIALYKEGSSFGKISQRLRLPRGTVQHLVEHFRSTGSIAPRPATQGRKPAFDGPALRRLEQDVLANPDATLKELRERSGKAVSLVTIHHTLRNKLGFTRKKRLYVRASNNETT